MILDTPDIVNILGKFIARAYCEKILPQKFIEIGTARKTFGSFFMTFYGFYDLCLTFETFLSFYKKSKMLPPNKYQIMITSYGFQKDQISIRTCWGEAGGFLDTTKLSEKVRTTV